MDNEEKRPLTLSEVMRLIAAQLLNDIVVDNTTALRMVQFYPMWETYIGKPLYVGNKVQYGGKLFEIRQSIGTVLENQPPGIETAALYKEINESHAGTYDDPIPYDGNLELFKGLYYIQNDILYKCTRDSINPLYNPLNELIGLYVELAETNLPETEPTSGTGDEPGDEPGTGNDGNEPENTNSGNEPSGNGDENTQPEDPGDNEPDGPIVPDEPVTDPEPIEPAQPGTLDNPIKYEMGVTVLENGLYYDDNGTIYKCTRDAGMPLYYALNALLGLYVETVLKVE